jgi:hypothetical protein
MNREQLVGRRVEAAYEIYAESNIYAYYLLRLDRGGVLFDNDAKLTPWLEDFDFDETVADCSLAAPTGPDPHRDFYIGRQIVEVLLATHQTKTDGLRRSRVYILLDNGYYLSSARYLGFVHLECDRFDRWYPENQYFEMLRDYWTGVPVNPFGNSARREVWRGLLLISPGSSNSGSET